MNKMLTIGSFLVCCLTFQTMSLFGMQHYTRGIVCPSEGRALLLTEVVNSAFQERVDDGAQFLDSVFRTFNRKAPISSQRVNLLFHNGSLYINRFFPINQAYDNIQISSKTYDSLQVSSVLGVDKAKVIAMQLIKENIAIMRHAVLGNYYSIKGAWNKIKGVAVEGRKAIIDSERAKCSSRTEWLRSYYISLCNFSCAASVLDYDISEKDFTTETLDGIYSHAQRICREYSNRIAGYISAFNSSDKVAFLQLLADGDILLKIQKACSDYGKYAHTEYMLKYHMVNTFPSIKSVQFVSYYDMCAACENLWAKVACGDSHVTVVSLLEYFGSRIADRREGNPNLMLIYR